MQSDLELLHDIVRQAGDVAHGYWGKDPQTWDKGGNAGPVSEADIETDSFLRQNLLSARPAYGWLSEETEDSADRLSRETVFIVDPIDGTRSFLEGGRTWAVSAAIIHNGVAVAGVIHMPAKGLTYVAARGQGAHLNGEPITCSNADDPADARILAARPALDARHWTGEPPAFDRHFRPSLAYRLGLVAEGKFDGMLTFRPTWEWDVAAGMLIAAEAGACATDQSGRMARFNSPGAQLDGIVVAPDRLHGRLTRALRKSAQRPE